MDMRRRSYSGWIVAAGIASLVGLGSALLRPGRVAGALPSALEMLARTLAAERSVDYAGILRTVIYQQGKPVASTVRAYRQAPNRERLEYESPELADLVAGCNEHFHWQYHPHQGQTILSRPIRSRFQGPRREELIRRNYCINCLGTDRVAGRPAYILELTPKQPGNPSRRLWVDQKTFTILRREYYTAEGFLQMQTTFQEINYHPRFSADLFEVPKPSRPPKAMPLTSAGQPLTLEQLSAQVGFTVILPPYLPPGYEYDTCLAYHCPCGCGMVSAQLQYIDGLNCLTVFETSPHRAGCCIPQKGAVAPGDHPSCLLADFGYTHFASVATTSPAITVVGEVAPEELIRVVEGLRQRAEPSS